jgi:uncharacterized SAM-binding protein YcdF (DUF218 family)
MREQPTALDSMRRYVKFAELARQYPEAKLMFSGGSGLLNPRAKMKDSEVARRILSSIGVPTDKIVFETASRNTFENASFSAQLAHPEKTQNWLLLTSAFHMPRAVGCFRQAGWNVFAVPAGYYTTGKFGRFSAFEFAQQMFFLNLALHEYAGLVSYWVMGRIDSLWPE